MGLTRHLAIPLLALSLFLGGCAGAITTAGNIGQSVSMATPRQASTLAEAVQMATLATMLVDTYVNAGNPTRATLEEFQILRAQVRSTLDNLNAANQRGESLAFAAFNEALRAFYAYAGSKGVQIAPGS